MWTRITSSSRGIARWWLVMSVVVFAGCATPGPETGALEPPELKPLGTPTRNVRFEGSRPIEAAAIELHSRSPISDTGSIPIIIHQSNNAIVETVFQIVPSEQACSSALEAYHKRLVAEHGDKIRHSVACVNLMGGELKGVARVADTLLRG